MNGYLSTSHRQFECSCGEPVKVPDYHNCKCGKIWNTYVIGTGGDRKEATAEKFIAREIPNREGVIVAKKKRHLQADNSDDKLENEVENNNPFPSKHQPRKKKDNRAKGVTDGKTSPDWYRRDHSSQQFTSRG